MNKYTYNITGLYRDWVEIKKYNKVIHNGSLLSLISYDNGILKLVLNYGLSECYHYELKRLENFVIAVPLLECLDNNYSYIPLIFTNDEYTDLIDVTYIDRTLLNDVKKLNWDDIFRILSNIFKNKFKISYNIDFHYIINNVVCFSEYDNNIISLLNNLGKREEIIIQHNEVGEEISVFFELDEILYEWNAIVNVDGIFYLKLIDDYMLKI